MVKKIPFLLGLVISTQCLADTTLTPKPDQQPRADQQAPAPAPKNDQVKALADFIKANNDASIHECHASLAILAWKRSKVENAQEKTLLDSLSANEFKRCTARYKPESVYSENSKYAAGMRDGLHTAAKTAYIEGSTAKAQELTTMANSWDTIATDLAKKAAEAQKTSAK